MSPLPYIPGYDLLRPLGGGPLTEVFAARRQSDDSHCAVKVPRDVWPGLGTAIRLLRREHRALRAARHRHLVRLLDAQLLEPPYFLVLELLDGETLRDRLQRDYALDLRTTAWIGRQVAEALAALHRAGFIHGDVKPENICLVDGGTAILIDLGFAHRPGESGDFAEEGYVLGTANYLAPEPCGEDPHDGFAADWFSFGAVMFEMLMGTLPRRHEEDLHHRRAWPPRLAALLNGLLASQPSARPPAALVIHELMALEIAALGRPRAA
jgi:eukaryotic-like serine/threonine-protein kinase